MEPRSTDLQEQRYNLGSRFYKTVTWKFCPRVSPTELSRQVIRGLRNSAGVLKTCWEDLSQFLRKCLSKGLHLSGWQNIFETNLLRRELKDKF